ncbi:dystrotelin [Scleropages formosus]|uniref:dystrotelin n=1 Tax=Scleropages formosus TaxID=113540 RepID=UPI0010FA7B5E|nr:dystrotelin [Scleropages formosus]
MDPNKINGLEGALSAVYRAALKLRSLQKLCQMDGVRTCSLSSALQSHGRNVGPGGKISKEEVGACLQRLFQGVSQDPPYQMTPEAIEHTTRLLFKLFDREQSGFVSLRSMEVVLIALSGDSLSAKHAALFQLAMSCSEEQDSSTVSQSGLRTVLEDLSQVPVVVQESHVFGRVDTAVQSCFQEILDGRVPEEHFLCWLRTEPQLLLWLSTLSKVSASEAVVHRVRCHTCKAFPIIGLRYRCLKCLNLHLCQTCFLAQRGTRKHKPSHPVLEYCTQPSLRESLASLAHHVQEKFKKRRFGRREAETRSAVCIPETLNGAQLRSSTPALTQDNSTEPKANFETTTSRPRVESKAMQTDTSLQTQEKTLLFKQDLYQTQMALRDLQREKRQLQKQFQVWTSSAQSEHNTLKNKCCQMEAAVEVLVHHNQNLQEELLRVQQMLEALTKEEEDNYVSDIKHPKAEKMVYNPSQTEIKTASAFSHEEGTAQTSHKVSGQSTENVVAQKPSRLSEWHPLDENQELKPYEDSTLWQDSHPGRENQNSSDSFVEQEAQLFDLVQRLKSSLTLNQQRGSISVPQGELLVAAEVVRSSISQLVSAVSLCSPPCIQTL